MTAVPLFMSFRYRIQGWWTSRASGFRHLHFSETIRAVGMQLADVELRATVWMETPVGRNKRIRFWGIKESRTRGGRADQAAKLGGTQGFGRPLGFGVRHVDGFCLFWHC